MFKIAVISVFFACALGAENLLCMRYCNDQATTLTCATNGEDYRIFKNECELKNKECTSGETWTTTLLTKCLKISLPIETPIVGIPEKPILLERAGCVAPCYLIYKPVCGYDGKEYRAFDNDCFMTAANCNRDATTSFLAAEPEKCNIVSISSS